MTTATLEDIQQDEGQWGLRGKRAVECPSYGSVPKDAEGNRRFRKWLCEQAEDDEDMQDALWQKCKEDLLFYVNAFVYIYEPRTAEVLPFVTYPFQDDALLEIDDAFKVHDLVIEKSRDMGATWMCIVAAEWRWHFYEQHSFLFLSQKQELVDKRGDPKALFSKLDFIHKRQPKWLVPKIEARQLHRGNLDNSSTIDGDATTGTSGTADRRTAVLFDEAAKAFANAGGDLMVGSSRDVTKCRLFNSTPWPADSTFEDLAHDDRFEKITLHWSKHPIKAAGLYEVSAKGEVTILDQKWHDQHPDYVCEKKPGFWNGLRSPWYDEECKRALSDTEMAREADIDYGGAASRYFNMTALNKIKAQTVVPPYEQRDPDRILKTPEGVEWLDFWKRMQGAKLLLWICSDADDQMPQDRDYVMGVDVAAGTGGKGGSNSVISVGDLKTTEKVLEFTWPKIAAHELAHLAVAIAKWFKGRRPSGPLINWEEKGHGKTFGQMIQVLGHHNVYYPSRNEFGISHIMSDTPGWNPSAENQQSLLNNYQEALLTGKFINRSHWSFVECADFVYNKAGRPQHRKAIHPDDPSQAGFNHGDRVIADALCWKAMSTRLQREKPGKEKRPVNSIGGRREAYKRTLQLATEGSTIW